MAASLDRFWSKVDKNGPVHPRLGARCWLWMAAKYWDGYGAFYVVASGPNKRQTGAHRFSIQMAMGMFWPDYQHLGVDHRCFNKLCVNPQHLRVVTPKQNSENRSGAQRNSQSGVRGVYWDPNPQRRKHWYGQVWHNGKPIHTGYFATKYEAEAARRERANELFTHNDVERITG